MLSETHEIDDIKFELAGDYEDFELDSEDTLHEIIRRSIAKVHRDIMKQTLYATEYERISALDKENITEVGDAYVYWGEVYLSCAEVYRYLSSKSDDGLASLSVEGISMSFDSGSQYKSFITQNYMRGCEQMLYAGYDIRPRITR